MNPSTWLSHNCLRIYWTSFSELASAHASAEALSCARVVQNEDALFFWNSEAEFTRRCTFFKSNVQHLSVLMFSCLSCNKAAPLSIKVSCKMTHPCFTVSFKDCMSVLRKRKFDGRFVNCSSCQSFLIAVWLWGHWHKVPQQRFEAALLFLFFLLYLQLD